MSELSPLGGEGRAPVIHLDAVRSLALVASIADRVCTTCFTKVPHVECRYFVQCRSGSVLSGTHWSPTVHECLAWNEPVNEVPGTWAGWP